MPQIVVAKIKRGYNVKVVDPPFNVECKPWLASVLILLKELQLGKSRTQGLAKWPST